MPLPLLSQLLMTAGTAVVFVLMNSVNEWLFSRFEFTLGISWVFLPAGIRLLSTLLCGTAGFVGLLIAGLLLNYFHFAFASPMRSLLGALAGALGPYLVYLYAEKRYAFHSSLSNLTPRRLLLLALLCSTASPLFHHLFFAFEGRTEQLAQSFTAMFIGDLTGTLIVLYASKFLLTLVVAHRSLNEAKKRK